MDASFCHFQVTMMNEIGARRRSKFYELWKDLDLVPKYVHSENTEAEYPFFSDSFNRHITGVAGCLNTHRKAWELFLQSEHQFALITEDDAIPSPKIGKEINRVISYVSDQSSTESSFAINSFNEFGKPALIQLGWFPFPKVGLRRYVVSAYHFLRYRGPVFNGYVRGYSFTVHCYLINREMATFLLDKVTSEGLPIDLQFMTLTDYHIYRECIILRSCANYAVQERIDSSIDSEADWGIGNKSTMIGRFLVWVQSIADAKGKRISI